VTLRPTVLRDGQDALAAAYGAETSFDYVFHGGSGSDPAEIAEAVGYGVVKMNVATDMQYAYTRAIAGHMFEHYAGVLKVDGDTGDKKAYDPRVWGRKGEEAMAARVAQACHDLRSAGRSLAYTAAPAA
jgi:fructose-bisphosphate aldolase class II